MPHSGLRSRVRAGAEAKREPAGKLAAASSILQETRIRAWDAHETRLRYVPFASPPFPREAHRLAPPAPPSARPAFLSIPHPEGIARRSVPFAACCAALLALSACQDAATPVSAPESPAPAVSVPKVGATTDTTFVDWTNPTTGVYSCDTSRDMYEDRWESYFYEVVAVYGYSVVRTSPRVGAAVARC